MDMRFPLDLIEKLQKLSTKSNFSMTEILIDAFVRYVDIEDNLENYTRTRENLAAAKGQIELLEKEIKTNHVEIEKLNRQLSQLVIVETPKVEMKPALLTIQKRPIAPCRNCTRPTKNGEFCSKSCAKEYQESQPALTSNLGESGRLGEPAGPEKRLRA